MQQPVYLLNNWLFSCRFL